MANELRLRRNNIAGSITDNPLTNGATTINSPGFVDLPVVDTTNHLLLILDPLEANGAAEIVFVTAHAAASSVVTVVRGAENSTPRQHPLGTTWFHGPVATDYRDLYTSSTRPTVPYTGQEILETDTLRNMQYTGTAWQQNGLYWDPPACRIFHSVNQTFTDATEASVTFDSERYDTDNMHDLVNPTRITFRTAGLYIVTGHIEWPAAADWVDSYLLIRVNGSGISIVTERKDFTTFNGSKFLTATTTYKFAVNDYVELRAYYDSASGSRNIIADPPRSPEFMATWIGRGN